MLIICVLNHASPAYSDTDQQNIGTLKGNISELFKKLDSPSGFEDVIRKKKKT